VAEVAAAEAIASKMETAAATAEAMEPTAASTKAMKAAASPAEAATTKTASAPETASAEACTRLRGDQQPGRHKNGEGPPGAPGYQRPTSAVHLRFSFTSTNLIRVVFLGICGAKNPAGNFGSKFQCDSTAEYWGGIGKDV
jgi:uncharacterized protein YfaS (alpha-2-macroglobulin family)